MLMVPAQTAPSTALEAWGLFGLTVMLLLGILGVVVLVRVLRPRRTDQDRNQSPPSQTPDPWDESARRLHIDEQEDDESWE